MTVLTLTSPLLQASQDHQTAPRQGACVPVSFAPGFMALGVPWGLVLRLLAPRSRTMKNKKHFTSRPGTKQNKYQKDGKTTTCASCGTFICVLEACVVALSSAQRGMRGLAVVGVLLR